MPGVHDISELVFGDSFVKALPADPSQVLKPRQVFNACYSLVNPTSVPNSQLIGWSGELAASLGIRTPSDRKKAAEILSGNTILPGMKPYAARYGGHQFGHWAGQLGDGRAITLGEISAPDRQLWDIQLKGAGPTPYSRNADGRAVLRSSVREFLCSEAMFHLGVPTTRALSLVATGDDVLRDMLYDGNPADEPGAIVCRVAPTFIRFGSFEILQASNEPQNLKLLTDYVISTHFKELGPPSPEVYGEWFAEVARRTAMMVAHWMRVGFVHGVMNSDNMSILGLTIDYGPYGWLEGYDPMWTPNTTDARNHRYCFGRQPRIAIWNLECLASALKPLFDQSGIGKKLEDGLQQFVSTFDRAYAGMFSEKIGLSVTDSEKDEELFLGLTSVLQATETDMTIFFRNLAKLEIDSNFNPADDAVIEPLKAAFYDVNALNSPYRAKLNEWLNGYAQRLLGESMRTDERRRKMESVNPKYVLRNYLAQLAIDDATQGDYGKIELLLKVLQKPYDEQPEHESLAVKRPEWARNKVGCSALSCSS